MPHSQSGCEFLPFNAVYQVSDWQHLHSSNDSYSRSMKASENSSPDVPLSLFHRPPSQEKDQRSNRAFPGYSHLIGESERIFGRPADSPIQFWRAAENPSEAQTVDAKAVGAAAWGACEYHLVMGTGYVFARHPWVGSGTGQTPDTG